MELTVKQLVDILEAVDEELNIVCKQLRTGIEFLQEAQECLENFYEIFPDYRNSENLNVHKTEKQLAAILSECEYRKK